MITLLITLAIGLLIWLFIWWLIFNNLTNEGRPHCFLSFHRFKTLNNLNEKRYCYCDWDYSIFKHLYLNNSSFMPEAQIQFHFISFLFFICWNIFRNIQKKRNIQAHGLKLVLTRGNEDIEAIRAQAEREIREAERVNNKVRKNFTKTKVEVSPDLVLLPERNGIIVTYQGKRVYLNKKTGDLCLVDGTKIETDFPKEFSSYLT